MLKNGGNKGEGLENTNKKREGNTKKISAKKYFNQLFNKKFDTEKSQEGEQSYYTLNQIDNKTLQEVIDNFENNLNILQKEGKVNDLVHINDDTREEIIKNIKKERDLNKEQEEKLRETFKRKRLKTNEDNKIERELKQKQEEQLKNQEAPVVRLTKQLYYIYKEANKKFFNNALPSCIITVQSKGRKNVYGWITTWKAWQVEDEYLYEINISSEHIINRSIEDIVTTLIHEMVHLYNLINGIKDVSAHKYHNKKFKHIAEKTCLSVDRDDNDEQAGFSFTKLDSRGKIWLNELDIDEDAFNIGRVDIPVNSKRKYKSRMYKWQCKCTIVRCSTQLNACCNTCNTKFEYIEEESTQ